MALNIKNTFKETKIFSKVTTYFVTLNNEKCILHFVRGFEIAF